MLEEDPVHLPVPLARFAFSDGPWLGLGLGLVLGLGLGFLTLLPRMALSPEPFKEGLCTIRSAYGSVYGSA